MTPEFAQDSLNARPLWLVSPGDLPEALDQQARDWAAACDFAGKRGQLCLLPDGKGGIAGALLGIGAASDGPVRERFSLAKAASASARRRRGRLRPGPQAWMRRKRRLAGCWRNMPLAAIARRKGRRPGWSRPMASMPRV
jgi:hypothetical protein